MFNEGSHFIESEKVQGVEKVCDLIDFGSIEWDVNLVQQVFSEKDAKAVLAVPLSEIALYDVFGLGVQQRWLLLG